MIYPMFSIYDRVSKNFCVPFACRNRADAERIFQIQIKSDSIMSQTPDDYEIWHVGDYDTETGIMAVELDKLIRGDDNV